MRVRAGARFVGGIGKMFNKVKTALRVFTEAGPSGIAYKLKHRYGIPIPQSKKGLWRANVREEMRWWDDYFQNEVVPRRKEYSRLRADTPLQERVVELLPDDREIVQILDVGAGPLTHLGKTCPGRTVRITAVDPLAPYYDRMLSKYGIEPLVRTMKADGEKLTDHFAANTFDLVYARNCIDHSYNPEKAVVEMIAAVRPGCFVLMEHHPNEAENVRYAGLHQWNFSMNDAGDFLIRSKAGEINMTQKYRGVCSIQCAMIDDGERWLITRIRKHAVQ
jgi:SAM-dependent methyltransferase